MESSDSPAPGTSPQQAGSSLVGHVLDERYRVIDRLGEGAMSVVYRAQQPDGTLVAIKALHQELGEDRSQRDRFEREAQALFGLEHPNIIDVTDFGVVDGAPYLVMEMLDGQPLDELLEDGPPDPDTALSLARQILAGLAYAHGHGALHRDLKTENVFVTQAADGSRVAKLLDFGLVKFVDEDRWGNPEKLTSFGAVFGTPAYMSPEQVSGSPVDTRTDVYAVGVMLFELLTGIWPFMEEDRVKMFRAHLVQPPPSLSEMRPEVAFSSELETIIQTALAKKQDDRYPDARAMLDAVDALPRPAWYPADQAPAAGSGATMASSGSRDLAQRARDNLPWLILAGAGVLLLAGGAAAALVMLLL